MQAMTKTKTLYDSDLVAWSERNAALLRAGQFSEVDIENVAEEIESLGRSDKRQLKNRVVEIIEHKLKLFLLVGGDRQNNERGWNLSIAKQQSGIKDLLEESPSLRTLLTAQFLVKCYEEGARDFAAGDFGCFANAPRECPWGWAEVLGS